MDPLLLEAIQRLEDLIERAREAGMVEPAAFSLATVGADKQPSARIVLLRGSDARGLVFYTNTASRKGRQLEENDRAAACFFWDPLAEQVRVEGRTVAVSSSEADVYWVTRPRESQIGAWASDQSQLLDSRQTLEDRVREFERRFADQPVPRPEHWSGYRLQPHRFEFWSGRNARLHERTAYLLEGRQWAKVLLFP